MEQNKKEKSEIDSQNLLEIKHRKPYQTTEFIYKALDMAEKQISELLEEVKELKIKVK